jgi:nucleoside-diphosphate-sugar epimerase
MFFKKKLPTKKKVLIIGSNGFIGKYLLKFLLKKKFICFELNRKKKINKNYITSDISSKKNFFTKMNSLKKNFDFVINLSGQISNDNEMNKTILHGNNNLISYFKKKKAKLIFVSTSLVYKGSDAILSENSNLLPNSDYSKNKILSENMYKKYSNNYVIFRLGNVYDESFNKKGLLKNISESIKLGRVLKIENLKAARSYVHVEDFCRAIYFIFKKSSGSEKSIYNFGKENLSNSDIIKLYRDKFKFNIKTNNLYDKRDPVIKISSKKFIKKYNFTYKNSLTNTIKNFLKK